MSSIAYSELPLLQEAVFFEISTRPFRYQDIQLLS